MNADDDFKTLPVDVCEKHVCARTRFSSWLDMPRTAGAAWLKSQLLGGV